MFSINFSVAGLGTIFLTSEAAYAATVTLLPNGIGNYNQWSVSSGNKVDAVVVSNGDTSYISEGDNDKTQTFSIANAGIPAGSTINSVTLYAVARGTSSGSKKFVLGVENGAGTFDSGSGIVATSGYSTSSRSMIINPLTELAWTLSEVNNWTTKFGVQRSNDVGTIRVTQIYVVVDYTANTVPVAQNKSISTDEDTAISSSVLATDANGDTLTYSIVANPTNGAISGFNSETGAFTYTPAANYNGADFFTFKANDGTADSNTATVSITVNPVNDAPVLTPIGDQIATELVAMSLTATSNDIDGGVPTYSLSGTAPAGAAIGASTGLFTWMSTEAQGPGSYTFDVIVSDGTDTDSETITVDVSEANIAPTATSTSVSTHMNTSKDITLVADDTDIPANALTFSVVSGPAHGTLDIVSISGDEATYTPDEDYTGADSFTFKANDGTDDSNIATVNINVDNGAPVIDAIPDQVAIEMIALNLTANASDPDSDPLTFSLGIYPDGALIDTDTGEFTWTPGEAAGGGVFPVTVIVSDGDMTDSASFNITVTETNEAPVAEDNTGEEDGGVTILEDTSVTITLGATDSDVPAQSLVFSTTTSPAHGTLGTISGNQVIYTPDANYNGSDSFTFKVNDGATDSNTATVDITVTPVNDAPTIELVGLSLVSVTVGDTYVEQGVTTNDVDSEVLTSTTTGSVDTNTVGEYALTYEVSDGELSASTTRTVNVTAVPPVDVCPNIEGTQETVPQGKQLTDGQCIDIPGAAVVPASAGGAVPLGFLGDNPGAPAGLVLGAATSSSDFTAAESCSVAGPYLTDYLRMGKKNNPEQVIKLQKFLNGNIPASIPVTGFFGPITLDAVKKFQTANADQILAPWAPYGLTGQTPTGYVYKTTRRWINILECKALDIPMPQLP
ncbi:MAG: tandem-95 repeat protein [Parcubacteria group bacterium]|nr:tandem-95 repeat protein [Parcubacteria group bacterium]